MISPSPRGTLRSLPAAKLSRAACSPAHRALLNPRPTVHIIRFLNSPATRPPPQWPPDQNFPTVSFHTRCLPAATDLPATIASKVSAAFFTVHGPIRQASAVASPKYTAMRPHPPRDKDTPATASSPSPPLPSSGMAPRLPAPRYTKARNAYAESPSPHALPREKGARQIPPVSLT